LVPPWPDAVVAVGRRTVSTARWIKEASGGRTKLIHLGRPRAPLSDFDLVVTTPQYGLPRARNVIEVLLPFALPKRATNDEYDRWRESWSSLPRPLVAVVVGGGKYPLHMGDAQHVQLAEGVNTLVKRSGGSAIVMLSPRSSANAAQLLGDALRVPNRIYPWGPGKPNPYQAALELADHFVVTSDSASMISEALATGRTVSLFSLPKSFLRLSWSGRRGLGAFLASNGVLQPPRNISKLSEILLRQGVVRQLGHEDEPVNPVRRADEIAIRRMKAMIWQS
jgi:mitochondrial fission protein ELM1